MKLHVQTMQTILESIQNPSTQTSFNHSTQSTTSILTGIVDVFDVSYQTEGSLLT